MLESQKFEQGDEVPLDVAERRWIRAKSGDCSPFISIRCRPCARMALRSDTSQPSTVSKTWQCRGRDNLAPGSANSLFQGSSLLGMALGSGKWRWVAQNVCFFICTVMGMALRSDKWRYLAQTFCLNLLQTSSWREVATDWRNLATLHVE